MIKIFAIGLWVCVVTLGSSYFAASFAEKSQQAAEVAAADAKPSYFEGLDYRKTDPLTVPIIADNEIRGYILARFVYTIDGKTLAQLKVPPEPFLVDQAFQAVYSLKGFDFNRPERYDLKKLTADMKEAVNQRFGQNVVEEVLVDQFDYIDKKDVKRG
ncbi:hypothetical protein [Consotaella salsifontis]|uniref:Flagellar protein FliL n=1 Tax=Consotaella salsifontis TaxID=1365950 RepID=A0A1T4NSK3_9HYPH|nr:hypothetical protein [Consotaella salsifontis]SJZ82279.1 hypothetical protein SAMN05428963_103172 [Consotaella salsifontis]